MLVNNLFKFFIVVGSEWVLWILIALSILAVAIYFNRMRVLAREEKNSKKFIENPKASVVCMPSRFIKLTEANKKCSQNDIDNFVKEEKLRLERYVPVLGTLGSNTPFIGLLGTVLGIIRAMSNLATSAQSTAGIQEVSVGISEALVATAVGLFVAIPCVIAFNYFNRRIKIILTRFESFAGEFCKEGR